MCPVGFGGIGVRERCLGLGACVLGLPKYIFDSEWLRESGDRRRRAETGYRVKTNYSVGRLAWSRSATGEVHDFMLGQSASCLERCSLPLGLLLPGHACNGMQSGIAEVSPLDDADHPG